MSDIKWRTKKEPESIERFGGTFTVQMSAKSMAYLDEIYNGSGPTEENLKALRKSLERDTNPG